MADRVVDGFVVWAGASQSGDAAAVPMVETKSVDGKVGTQFFRVITTEPSRTAERAMEIARDVVARVQSVNEKGVPHPLTY